MGWNKRYNFYGFCNGIVSFGKGVSTFLPIDKNGIVENNGKHFFIPGMSEMYADKDELFESEKKFIYRKPIADFGINEWASLFFKAYGDKAKGAIPFYLAALFSDIIFKEMRRFPLLNLYGPPSSGKTTFAESLLYMFGDKQVAVMLGAGSIKVGLYRKLAFAVNGLAYLDEYKNSLPADLIDGLKGIHERISRTTGRMTNDLHTQNTNIKSAVILGGADIPTIDSSLPERLITLSFEEGKFNNNQRAYLLKLQEMETNGGFSYITVDLLKHRHLIEANFKHTFSAITRETFIDVANIEIEDRLIRNISILLTMVYLLKNEINFPFSYEECKAFLIKNMKYNHSIIVGNNEISKFWSIIESLSSQNKILYGREFMIKDGFLYIRLRLLHPLYMKEMRLRGDNNALSSVESLRDYLSHNKKAYIEYTKQRFPFEYNSASSVSCDKFKYDELNIELNINDEELLYGKKDQETIIQLENRLKILKGAPKKNDALNGNQIKQKRLFQSPVFEDE